MTVLELRFPAGRFHATPWGRHVNEGVVEWPPAPWRIVRALIATWHLKAREIPEETARSLVNALSQPPTFHLPRASTSHTRHYLPFNEGKNEKTTKVFDTFILLPDDGAILVAWDATVSPAELDALRNLAHRIGYFGRAESLVEARVLDGITAIDTNATPLAEGTSLPKKAELVRLLAPMLPTAYDEWRGDFMAKAEAALGPKPTAAQKKKLPKLPDDLFAALHADTGDLQAAGWNLPPGAAIVNYTRPENAFAPAPRPRPQQKGPRLTVARYAVTSTVAPSITQAISIGDRVHDSLCRWSDQGRGPAAVFTGRNANRDPLKEHQHTHIFCEAHGPRDSVTHITIWAEMGFDEEACLALRRLNKVWGHGGHDIRLVLHGIGQPDDFKDCGLFGKARVWRSLTPFVSTRHAKTFRDGRPKMDASGWQVGSGAHDLLRLLALHPQGTGATIKQLDERERPFAFGVDGERRFRSLQFQTIRHDGGGNRGNSSGNAFMITFPEPICGPLALGYGSHFGLGLFQPQTENE
ncbi:MAG: type I-U CRISPR-associated protein Csb2 [Verrucomicrobia bacterium]|nr:type I-U CRISPR-associated protein Csb2 [Verrucomicrobiota bacterium]